METRTVDVLLQRPDGTLVARLTVNYPLPAMMSYAGQQWLRTISGGATVYQADRPSARPPADVPLDLRRQIVRLPRKGR